MKNKPNISLFNLAELRSSGLFLAVRKGMNEILNRSIHKHNQVISAMPKSSYKPIISVIICTSGRQQLALNAINSILNEDFTDFEIILVNNNPDNFDHAQFGGSVKYMHEPVQGLSRARNRGAQAASGEFLLYIDDDAIACENLLSSIHSAFLNHPDMAIIGGQIFLKIPEFAEEIVLEGKEALWSAYTVSYKHLKEVREQYEFPYGACFAIRHSVLDKIGGFPHSYGRCGNNYAGGEETAVCFAAKKLGFKIGIEPSAAVLHCVSAERFTHEHIRKTTRASILTTYRLSCDGYSDCGWTSRYVDERLSIIRKELEKASGLSAFYKQCEYDAFSELKEIINL